MRKKIFVVDDSALMRRVVCDIINSDDRFEVVDTAKDGVEAYNKLIKNQYDAVVLDVYMPRMTGLVLLEELQKAGISCKVMMASTTTGEGAQETIEALELGAIDFIKKPEFTSDAKKSGFKDKFLETLFAVASAKLPETKKPRINEIKQSTTDTIAKSSPAPVRETSENRLSASGEKLVAIASSTGGPKSLQEVIPYLPKNLNAPVLLVQHMPKGFTESLANRLNEISQIEVSEARDGEKIVKGHVYIAQGGMHMKLEKRRDGYYIKYSDEPPREGVKPCANYMYESLIQSDFSEIVCVVLTGMGADGTAGIKNLNQHKKIYVYGQDEDTCIVYGMPRAIANSGLVNEVIPLQKVAEKITKNVGVR